MKNEYKDSGTTHTEKCNPFSMNFYIMQTRKNSIDWTQMVIVHIIRLEQRTTKNIEQEKNTRKNIKQWR